LTAVVAFVRWLPLASGELLDADFERKPEISKRNGVKTNRISICHLLGDASLLGIGRRFSDCLSNDVLSNDVALRNLRDNDSVSLEKWSFDNKGKLSCVTTS
jgi:hypothetical protein